MFRNRTGEHGFSLIEAVMAIGLFSLCILAAAQMAASVIKTNQVAREYTAALFLARNKMEEIKAREFGDVVSGEENAIDAGGAIGSGAFNRSVRVSDQDTPRSKTVTVRVGWGGNDSRQVVLATIISPGR